MSKTGPIKTGPAGPLATAMHRFDTRQRRTEMFPVAEHS